ncbi:MAG: tol-pal system YbgF family protein [Flavobacteriales bacterium]
MLKFINKQLSQKELHQVQTHLIDCDFCSEALEGMAHAKNPSILFTIDHQIDNLTSKKSPSIARILLVAASVLLFVFGGYYTINNFNDATKFNENEISFKEPQKNTVENILPEQEELLQKQKEQKEEEGEKTIRTINIETQNKEEEIAEAEANEKWSTNFSTIEESPVEQQIYQTELAKDKTTNSSTSLGNTYKATIQDNEDVMMDMDKTIAPAPKVADEKAKADMNLEQKTANQLTTKTTVTDNLKKSGEVKKPAKKEMEALNSSSDDDFKNKESDEIAVKKEEILTRTENTLFEETISTTEVSGGISTGTTMNTRNILADGITYYNQKKYTTAVKEFDLVLNGTDNATKKSEARWYKALCLIELKDITEAKKLLTMLTQYNNTYSKQAEEKLKALE